MCKTTPLTVIRQTVFETARFRLRPAGAQDQALMYAWRSDHETARYLSGPPPASLQAQRAWFERVRDDARRSYHVMEDRQAHDEPLGYASLVCLGDDPLCAEWGVVMGHRRGSGLVRLLAPLCCHIALGLGGLQRLYACIHPGNVPAQRKMQTLGAVAIDGPHPYRKAGEHLYEIDVGPFALAVQARQGSEPDLAAALQVRAIPPLAHAQP